MRFHTLVCLLLALSVLSASSLATASAEPGRDAVAAKKKCKKGKKGKASAAKKKGCKGKKRKAPAATGPQIPAGDYACSYYSSYGSNYAGTVHILAGNRYTVNEGSAGSYKYFPDTGIIQFPTGDYKSFFARYSPDAKGFDVFSAVNDGVLQYGDYGWTCSTS